MVATDGKASCSILILYNREVLMAEDDNRKLNFLTILKSYLIANWWHLYGSKRTLQRTTSVMQSSAAASTTSGCKFWVYNAKHDKSFVSPTILSKSKVTIRASYMAVDGSNEGFAPGPVTVDDIYHVTPAFVLSLRDNKDLDLSKCGKTTPAS
jgi:hypothetical protein